MVLRDLINAIRNDDWPSAQAAFTEIESLGLMRQAFSEISKLNDRAPINFAKEFHLDWTCRSRRIREKVADDETLLDSLRILLPPYQGMGLNLYRGESFQRYHQRRIGSGWTSKVQIAEMFAAGLNAIHPDGGIVLSTFATQEAIIASPSDHSIYLAEYEYTVDRRKLEKISEKERFPPRHLDTSGAS